MEKGETRGSVYGSIRILNRTSDFWSRVELVEHFGWPAGPESLSSDVKVAQSNDLLTTWRVFWTMRQSSVDAAARCPVITILQLSKCVIGLAENILAVHLYKQTST